MKNQKSYGLGCLFMLAIVWAMLSGAGCGDMAGDNLLPAVSPDTALVQNQTETTTLPQSSTVEDYSNMPLGSTGGGQSSDVAVAPVVEEAMESITVIDPLATPEGELVETYAGPNMTGEKTSQKLTFVTREAVPDGASTGGSGGGAYIDVVHSANMWTGFNPMYGGNAGINSSENDLFIVTNISGNHWSGTDRQGRPCINVAINFDGTFSPTTEEISFYNNETLTNGGSQSYGQVVEETGNWQETFNLGWNGESYFTKGKIGDIGGWSYANAGISQMGGKITSSHTHHGQYTVGGRTYFSISVTYQVTVGGNGVLIPPPTGGKG